MHRLSWSVSSNVGENSLFKCASQPEIAKNSLKTPIFRVQGRSRSSMLVQSEKWSAVLVIICNEFVSICNRSLARRANSGKNNVFLGGYPSLMPSFKGNLLTQRHGNLFTRNSRLHAIIRENSESLSHLGLNRCRVVKDRRTELR